MPLTKTLGGSGGGGSSLTVKDEGSTLTTAATSLNFVTGTQQVLGNWVDYSNQWSGHVHEMAVWSAQLSGSEITQVESYVTDASRYGSTW